MTAGAFFLPPVYPRGCGGTNSTSTLADRSIGLSPRVRGNLPTRGVIPWPRGSIPAGAGEPRFKVLRGYVDWVYPRGCGGTPVQSPPRIRRLGLSPRVRGNPGSKSSEDTSIGSIPAGAGEPRFKVLRGYVDWVYPRGCGGTPVGGGLAEGRSPLSPRVRGNPGSKSSEDTSIGSIPAGAGEPWRSSGGKEHPKVYPRGCGGTDISWYCYYLRKGLSPRVRGNPMAA